MLVREANSLLLILAYRKMMSLAAGQDERQTFYTP